MRKIILALTATATCLSPILSPQVQAAEARNGDTMQYVQWRRPGWHAAPGWHARPFYHPGPRYGYYAPRYGYYYGRPYYRDSGAAAAAGAIGLATGAIIGGAIANQSRAPVVSQSVSACAQRYKSYNPATGTYLGYDGNRHPCP